MYDTILTGYCMERIIMLLRKIHGLLFKFDYCMNYKFSTIAVLNFSATLVWDVLRIWVIRSIFDKLEGFDY
jgi:hypothetical protein